VFGFLSDDLKYIKIIFLKFLNLFLINMKHQNNLKTFKKFKFLTPISFLCPIKNVF